jgi:hypothetical protein
MWGGDSPQQGSDCGGTIYIAFNGIGIGFPRIGSNAIWNLCKNQLKPDPRWGPVGKMFRLDFAISNGVATHVAWRPYWSLTIESRVDEYDDEMSASMGRVTSSMLSRSVPKSSLLYTTLPTEMRSATASGWHQFLGLLDIPMAYRRPAWLEWNGASPGAWYSYRIPLESRYSAYLGKEWYEDGYIGPNMVTDGFNGKEASYDGFRSTRTDQIMAGHVPYLVDAFLKAYQFLLRNDYNGQSISKPYSSPMGPADFGGVETYLDLGDYTYMERPGRTMASQYWGDSGAYLCDDGGTRSFKHIEMNRIVRKMISAAMLNILAQAASTIPTGDPWGAFTVPDYDDWLRILLEIWDWADNWTGGAYLSWGDHYIEAQPIREAMLDAMPDYIRFGGLNVHHRSAFTSGGESTERFLPFEESYITNVLLAFNESKRVHEDAGGL